MEKIKVFGERNTSTNAIIKAIRRNAECVEILPSTASELDSCVSGEVKRIGRCYSGIEGAKVREEFIDSIFSGKGINNAWKHAATNFDSFCGCDDVKFVITVRHPASWLLALHKRPYHALQDVEKEFEKFIVQPWKTVQRDRLNGVTTNPIDLWNIKCSSYINFLKSFHNKDNLFIVKFEDFAQSQKQALEYLLSSLGVDGENYVEICKSLKNDGKNVEWYREYYGNELWRKNISSQAWSIIRKNVDPEVSDFFSYVV